MEEETFSYELLFEVLMREKNKEELQKLDEDFFLKAKSFIFNEKKLLSNNISSFQKIKNLENMLFEIYSRREKKIVNLAIIKARTDENIFDISVMLPEEREMFNKIVEVLKSFRNKILNEEVEDKIENVVENKDFSEDKKDNIEENFESNIISENKEEYEEKENNVEEENNNVENDFVKVLFLKPVNKFVDEDLNYYGPFDEDETASIPKKIAMILVSKGEAKILE